MFRRYDVNSLSIFLVFTWAMEENNINNIKEKAKRVLYIYINYGCGGPTHLVVGPTQNQKRRNMLIKFSIFRCKNCQSKYFMSNE